MAQKWSASSFSVTNPRVNFPSVFKNFKVLHILPLISFATVSFDNIYKSCCNYSKVSIQEKNNQWTTLKSLVYAAWLTLHRNTLKNPTVRKQSALARNVPLSSLQFSGLLAKYHSYFKRNVAQVLHRRALLIMQIICRAQSSLCNEFYIKIQGSVHPLRIFI